MAEEVGPALNAWKDPDHQFYDESEFNYYSQSDNKKDDLRGLALMLEVQYESESEEGIVEEQEVQEGCKCVRN